MEKKVEVAVYVPYRRNGKAWEFFLQKRDGNAPTHPNIFSMFGGHMEADEDSYTAVIREVAEELAYVPVTLHKFPRTFISEVNGKVFDVYTEEVDQDFESKVTVLEGEYGRFFTSAEIAQRTDISGVGKDIVASLNDSFG